MRRSVFLLVTPREAGHSLVMLSVARALVARGHRALVYAHPDVGAAVEAAGAELVPCEAYEEVDIPKRIRLALARGADEPAPGWLPRRLGSAHRVARNLARGRGAVAGGARRMAEELRAIITAHRPRLLLADATCLGARYAAELTATPFATLGADPLTVALDRQGVPDLPPVAPLERLPPSFVRYLFDAALPLRRVRRELGLPPQHRTAEVLDLMASERLHIVPSLPDMIVRPPAEGHLFVGPMSFDRDVDAPAPEGLPDNFVLVTWLTLEHPGAAEPFRRVAAAVAASGRPAVIVTGGLSTLRSGDLGPHVRVLDAFVPLRPLLARASAFVTHGGWGAIGLGLRAGVPMLLTPAVGAALRLAPRAAERGFARVLPARSVDGQTLRDALDSMLADEAWLARVRAVKGRLEALRPAETAADALERLAARSPGSSGAGSPGSSGADSPGSSGAERTP